MTIHLPVNDSETMALSMALEDAAEEWRERLRALDDYTDEDRADINQRIDALGALALRLSRLHDQQPRHRVTKCCSSCGSDDIVKDAWAEWDEDKQDWVLSDVFDHTYCRACEGETEEDEHEITTD